MQPALADVKGGLMNERIAELETRLQAMAGELAALAAQDSVSNAPRSRRNALRGAALAAGGTVAATLLTAQPARAANGAALVIGDVNNSCTALTGTNMTSASTSGAAFLFQTGSAPYPAYAFASTALVGAATSGASQNVGVMGFANAAAGEGVRGYSANGKGVYGFGAVANFAMGTCGGDPRTTTTSHTVGDIYTDTNDVIWVCVVAGTPGTWRKIGSASTAGAFHALAPFRAYDSRVTAPTGQMGGGANRVISVKNAYSGASVSQADALPTGATAVTGNLTVTNTSGAGYLSVMPGNAASFTSSTINWGGADTRANGFVCSLDDARQLKIFCGGGGSCDFIIDITGYYL